MASAPTDPRVLDIDGSPLRVEDVADLARGHARCRLSADAGFQACINRGAEFVDRLIAEDGAVYGVSTGYGDSCTVVIPPAQVAELRELGVAATRQRPVRTGRPAPRARRGTRGSSSRRTRLSRWGCSSSGASMSSGPS